MPARQALRHHCQELLRTHVERELGQIHLHIGPVLVPPQECGGGLFPAATLAQWPSCGSGKLYEEVWAEAVTTVAFCFLIYWALSCLVRNFLGT